MIFEYDKSGNLIKNCLLRQDILRYCLVKKPGEDNRFVFSELVVWLIEHNQEISNYYKDLSTRNTPKRNIIANRWDRIKKKFEELKMLELVREVDSKRTSKGVISPVYEYTEFGQLVSLVIDLSRLEIDSARRHLIEKIYNLLCSIFSTNQSVSEKYNLHVFEKLWDNKLFVQYLQAFARQLGCKRLISDEIDDSYNATWRDFLKIKEEAFNALLEEERRIFLYSQKIIIESIFYRSSHDLKGFEEIAFACRGSPWRLAVEGSCQSCRLIWPLEIKTLDYFYTPAYASYTATTCPKCKIPNAITIAVHRGHENPLITVVFQQVESQ